MEKLPRRRRIKDCDLNAADVKKPFKEPVVMKPPETNEVENVDCQEGTSEVKEELDDTLLHANQETLEQEEQKETSETPTKKRTDTIDVSFRGQKYRIPPLFQTEWNLKNGDRTLLNDTLIEFYMCNYMWNSVYDDEARQKFHVFHTFFYSKLKLRFGKYYKEGPPRRSELSAHFNRFFQKVKPSLILNKEILVIPVHLEKPKHWFLVVVHNPSGAIRRFTPVDKSRENYRRKSLCSKINEFVEVEDKTRDARIIIMDSLCGNKKYGQVLDQAYMHAFDYISLWLQMAAAADGEELMVGRMRRVVCETLPKQKNCVDCGIYMLAYAEYFTWYNTEWTTLPTESLTYLIMEDDLKSMLNSEEPRLRLERLLQKFKVPTANDEVETS